MNGGDSKSAVEQSATNKKYCKELGQGSAELFVQFFTRVYHEIPNCVLAEFSKLKILQGPHFSDFRTFFLAKLVRLFCVPAKSFDNVSGDFPIGFFVWKTDIKETFKEITSDIFNIKGEFLMHKKIGAYDNAHFMNEWIKPFRGDLKRDLIIGKFPFKGNDFQNQRIIQIVHPDMIYNKAAGQFLINPENLSLACIYFAIRKCIEATWLNDRDQFLFPNDGWKEDAEFQSDCLAYTLFNNNIQSQYGTNYWIPFTEEEVNAQEKFESNFMAAYIAGKSNSEAYPTDLFSATEIEFKTSRAITFSATAQDLLNVGRELWRYYHAQPRVNPNASLYDIREYFQGRNDKGKMNSGSEDEKYNKLITTLRQSLKFLAKKIEPKVYEFGFLKK